jgi:hypothetical protein
VTLPPGSDPLPDGSDPAAVVSTRQDDLGAPIRACKWQSPDVAWVLCEQRIERLARTPNSHDGGGPGTWTPQTLTPPGWNPSGKEKKRPPAPPLLGDAKVWTDIAPDLDQPPAPGQPPVQHGLIGALYIGTTGNVDKPGVDTLWWFDGIDHFHPTGLRAAVPAPVTAVLCDPLSLRQVWVGTTVGVWHGERTDHASGPPTWLWTQMVNGLPEAAVEDLAIFRDGTLVLLRVAIASRGVWELRLDDTTVQDRTYLRVHDDDLRHRLPTPLVQRNLAAGRSWHGSPDVRPRVAPAPPAPPTAAAPWTRAAPPGEQALRRFQAALRSSTNDPRVVANGVWDAYFSEVLRDLGAPTTAVPAAPPLPALNVVQVDPAYFTTHVTAPHATAEPWGSGVPTEADLYELLPRLTEGTAGATSCQLPPGPARVDVVVHRRGLDPIDGANVRVTLLAWMDPATPPAATPNAPGTWFAGPVPWTDAVNQVLNSGDGKTALPVGAGWRFVLGGATDSHRVALTNQTIDPVRAGIATFDLDLSGVAPETVVLLVAVIRAGTTAADDVALAAADLETLTRNNANVAVRSLRVAP